MSGPFREESAKDSGAVPGPVEPCGGVRSRPILFSAPMVGALLAGTKTQTRRIVKAVPEWAEACHNAGMGGPGGGSWWDFWCAGRAEIKRVRCPYGVPGDTLWVREACRAEELSRPPQTVPATRREREQLSRTTVVVLDDLDGVDGVRYLADNAWEKIENTAAAGEAWSDLYHYRGEGKAGLGNHVPGIHMPRWASRITLQITDVRVERLNEISEADARAEGVRQWPDGRWSSHDAPLSTNELAGADAATGYHLLWEEINGRGSWAANPWVWAVSFEVSIPSMGASPASAPAAAPEAL